MNFLETRSNSYQRQGDSTDTATAAASSEVKACEQVGTNVDFGVKGGEWSKAAFGVDYSALKSSEPTHGNDELNLDLKAPEDNVSQKQESERGDGYTSSSFGEDDEQQLQSIEAEMLAAKLEMLELKKKALLAKKEAKIRKSRKSASTNASQLSVNATPFQPAQLHHTASNQHCLPMQQTAQMPSHPVNSPEPTDLLTQLVARQSLASELPTFDGNPTEWSSFIDTFRRTTALCRFTDEENVLRLQKCLKGEASRSVRCMLRFPKNLMKILETLEVEFGRTDGIIKAMIKEVKSLPNLKESSPKSIMELSLGVNNLIATLEILNSEAHKKNHQLLGDLENKLTHGMKLAWGSYVLNLPGEADVGDFAKWLSLKAGAARRFKNEETKDNTEKKDEWKKRKSNVLTTSDSSDQKCALCDNLHKLTECSKFGNMNVSQRKQLAFSKRLCFRCLKGRHVAAKCRTSKRCKVKNCGRRHHTLLHEDAHVISEKATRKPEDGITTVPEQATNTEKNETTAQLTVMRSCRLEILMRVVPITIFGPKGYVSTYALLDEGSSWTLVDQALTKELGIRGKRETLKMSWLDGAPKSDKVFNVNLRIRGDGEEFHLNNVKAISNLNLPTQSIKTPSLQEKWKHLQGLPLPELNRAKPRLLLGQDFIHLTVAREVREGPKNSPIATLTKLGWVVHGRNCFKGLVNSHVLFTSSVNRDEELHQLVKDHFSLESIGIRVTKPLVSKENERAIAITDRTTRRVGERWETGLLWKSEELELPPSYENAYKRLLSIERRAKKDALFKDMYVKNMQTYVDKGYARKLESAEVNSESKRTWYLPHFGVVNPNKPGKFRIVFDAAARSNGTSLNKNLLSGPDLLSSLVSMLFKFRSNNIAFAADIKEMFPQIRIRKEDAVAQRFLWRKMDDTKGVDVYQMDVMIFGAKCSPYSAQEVRNRNALELKERFPAAVEAITRKHYMDDYLDSVATEEEAIALIRDVIHVHKTGGFELTNWISNSDKVLQSIPESFQLKQMTIKDPSAVTYERVLGMYWDPKKDVFIFTVNQKRYNAMLTEERLTKRKLLSHVMSLFDPLGLLADCIIKARILIQDVWRSGVGWDDEVTAKVKLKWQRWVENLRKIENVTIPRNYTSSQWVNTELHVFTDASEEAYAAVAYIVSRERDTTQSCIVMSKTRVAPLKPTSIPRMELQGALKGARMSELIKREHDVEFGKRFFWTDSRTVLSWINSDARSYKQFVSNRIGEILELTDVSEWRWCPTALNAADEATRSAGNWDPVKSTWRVGPEFLSRQMSEWPSCKILETGEERREACVLVAQPQESLLPSVTRFSSYIRVLRATARVLQAILKFKSKLSKQVSTELSVEIVEKAEILLLKESQKRWFSNEIGRLKNGKQVDRSSSIATLSPYLDDIGLLRIKGRIERARVCVNVKRPVVILHPKDELTRLLIDHYHVQSLHMGQERVVNELRQKYWILNARNAVRSAWARCEKCKARRAQPQPPIMGQLPDARVNPVLHAFASTGVDYFGPIMVTVKRSQEKRWGVLFTCLSTRAIHLELAFSLSTDSCIEAIRRFCARRGQPLEIWSDNGTNFRGADNELSELLKQIDTNQMESELSTKGIKWNFIPPSTPHMGGCWERQIRTVKSGLNALLKERAPRDETLLTFFSEVEAIVNSTPLTHVSLDPADDEALTPSHFLLGRSSFLTPYRAPDCEDQCLKKKWLLAQKMADQFWHRWTKEYLPTLTRRTKWFTDTGQVNIGDVVILVDENQPRGTWPKGIITQIHPGKDGRIRVVDVKTKTGTYKRPVHKLCVLQSNVGKDVTALPRGRMLARSVNFENCSNESRQSDDNQDVSKENPENSASKEESP